MKIFENEYTLDYPWSLVTLAHWQKYPNENCRHVLAVDVLRREVDPQTGILRTERLITCHQSAPKWILKLMGASSASYVREVSEIDPKTRILVLRSVNLTYCNVLNVYEQVSYQPHSEGITLFRTHATIISALKTDGLYRKLANKVEEFSFELFKKNAMNGKQGFERVLERIQS